MTSNLQLMTALNKDRNTAKPVEEKDETQRENAEK